jgi:hypothetical protein
MAQADGLKPFDFNRNTKAFISRLELGRDEETGRTVSTRLLDRPILRFPHRVAVVRKDRRVAGAINGCGFRQEPGVNRASAPSSLNLGVVEVAKLPESQGSLARSTTANPNS